MTNINSAWKQKEVPELTPQAVESADFAAGMQMPPTDGSGLFMIPEPEETNDSDLKMPRPKLSVCDHFSLYEQLLQIKRSAIELRSALEHGAVNAEGSGSGVPSMDTVQQLNALAMRTLSDDSDSSSAAGSNPSEQLIVDVAKRLREEQKRLTELQQLIEMTTESTPSMQALGLSSGPLATLVEAPEHNNSPTRASPELVKPDGNQPKASVVEVPEMETATVQVSEEDKREPVEPVPGAEAAAGGTLRAALIAEGALSPQPATVESATLRTEGSLRAPLSAQGSLRAPLTGEGPPLRRMSSFGSAGDVRQPLGPGRMQSSGSTGEMRSADPIAVAGVSLRVPAADSPEGVPKAPPPVTLQSPVLQTRSASIRNLPPSVRQSSYAGVQAGAMRQGSLPLPRSPMSMPRSPRLSLGRDTLLRPGSTSLPLGREASLSPMLQPGDRGPPRGGPGGLAQVRADSAEPVPPVVAALQGVPFGSSGRQSLNGDIMSQLKAPSRASSLDPATLAASLQAAVENAALNPQLQPTVVEAANRLSAPSLRSPPPSVPVTPNTTSRDTRMQAVLRVRQPRNSLKVSPTPRNAMLQATPVPGMGQAPGTPQASAPMSSAGSASSSVTSSTKGGSFGYPPGPNRAAIRAKAKAYPVRQQASPERVRATSSPGRGRPMTPSRPVSGANIRMPSNPRQSLGTVGRMRTCSPTGVHAVATVTVPPTTQVDPLNPPTSGPSITVSAPSNVPPTPLLSLTEVPLVAPGTPQVQAVAPALPGSFKAPLTSAVSAIRPIPTVSTTSAGSSVSVPMQVASLAPSSPDEKQKEVVEKQKEVQSQDLMERLKRDAEALAAMHKQQEGLLHALANQEKKQFEVMMEQRVQQEEFVLMRQFREQVMRLTQTAQARRAELEKKALEANLAWQQKKVEDVYLEKKSTMEQEYQKAQEKLTAEISKLNSKRSPPTSLRQHSPAGVPTSAGGRNPGSYVAAVPGTASGLPGTPTQPIGHLAPQLSSFQMTQTPQPVVIQAPTLIGNAGSRQNSPAIKPPVSGLVARNLVAVPTAQPVPSPSTQSKDD